MQCSVTTRQRQTWWRNRPESGAPAPGLRGTIAFVTRVEEIYREAIELDEKELAELVERLSLMLPAPQIHESWLEVVRQRQRELNEGTLETVPWTEVRERMFKRARGD